MLRLALVVVLACAWVCPSAHAQSANLLSNGSFELGSARGWGAYGGDPAVSVGSLATPGAREGASVGVAQVSQAGASFSQDVSFGVQPNRSYSLSLWVKSADGSPVTGTLAISGILNTATEATGKVFTAGADWTLVSATLNTERVHDALRAQVYLDTTACWSTARSCSTPRSTTAPSSCATGAAGPCRATRARSRCPTRATARGWAW
jgi:hypothetical protein